MLNSSKKNLNAYNLDNNDMEIYKKYLSKLYGKESEKKPKKPKMQTEKLIKQFRSKSTFLNIFGVKKQRYKENLFPKIQKFICFANTHCQ